MLPLYTFLKRVEPTEAKAFCSFMLFLTSKLGSCGLLCLRKHHEFDSDVQVNLRDATGTHSMVIFSASFSPRAASAFHAPTCSHISRPAAERQSPGVELKVGEHNKINQSLMVTDRVAEWGGGGDLGILPSQESLFSSQKTQRERKRSFVVGGE